MSWFEMSRDSLRAAKQAHKDGYARSAVSRAYFSAYAALAGVFGSGGNIEFRYGGNNPSHQQLLALTANNLDPKQFPSEVRRNIKRSLRILQASRINADYNPDSTCVTDEDSLICVRHASEVLLGLGALT